MADNILVMDHITKEFPGVKALDNVNLVEPASAASVLTDAKDADIPVTVLEIGFSLRGQWIQVVHGCRQLVS